MQNFKPKVKASRDLTVKFYNWEEQYDIDFVDFQRFSNFFEMLEIDNSNMIELDP